MVFQSDGYGLALPGVSEWAEGLGRAAGAGGGLREGRCRRAACGCAATTYSGLRPGGY